MNHRTGPDLKVKNSLLQVTHLCTEFDTKPSKNKHLGTVILCVLTVFLALCLLTEVDLQCRLLHRHLAELLKVVFTHFYNKGEFRKWTK